MAVANTILIGPGALQAQSDKTYASASTSAPAVATLLNCNGFDTITIFVESVAVTSSTLAVWMTPDGTEVVEAVSWRRTHTGQDVYEVPVRGAQACIVQLHAVAGGSGTTGFSVYGS